MSVFERLLAPGSTELPSCRCGKEMEIASIERLPEGSDAAVRVYRCPSCHHEMRLTVWATETMG
jgi:DNA-directed RNA polymerase subunit RPC12/RpoP